LSTSGSPGDAAPKGRTLFGVPRVVVLLGVVSFLNDLSGEMITPLLPLFLVGALLAPVAVVGLIEGSADSATALLKVWVGHRSDLLQKRKRYILTGYGAGGLAKPLLALSVVWPQALGARLLDRIGKGVRGAPRDAAIADASPPEIVGRSFGLHRAFDTAGAIGGTLIALALVLLLERGGSVPYRIVFLAASIPAIASVMLLAAGYRDPKPLLGRASPDPSRPGFVAALRALPRPVRAFIGVTALFTVGNFTIGLFVLRLSGFAGSVTLTLAAYALFNLLATLLSTPAGVLADRHGRRALVRVSFALFSAAALAFALADSFLAALLAFLVYGAFFAVWESCYRAYLSEICPKELRATALGAHGTVIGLLALPGSLMAGLLWDTAGPTAPFLLAAAIGVAAFVALSVVRADPPPAVAS
jgi:MFS family permease